MKNRFTIGYDPFDILDNYRFVQTTLKALAAKGLEYRFVDQTVQGVAKHIRYKLGFNGCHIVRFDSGSVEFVFFKEVNDGTT